MKAKFLRNALEWNKYTSTGSPILVGKFWRQKKTILNRSKAMTLWNMIIHIKWVFERDLHTNNVRACRQLYVKRILGTARVWLTSQSQFTQIFNLLLMLKIRKNYRENKNSIVWKFMNTMQCYNVVWPKWPSNIIQWMDQNTIGGRRESRCALQLAKENSQLPPL